MIGDRAGGAAATVGPRDGAIEAHDLVLRVRARPPGPAAISRSGSSPASASPSSGRTVAASRRSRRLLVGLLRPARGSVRLGGDDPARLPAARARPPGGLRLPGARAPVPRPSVSATRSCSGSIPTRHPAAEALLDDLGHPARAVRRSQSVPAVGRGGAPAVARGRPGAATRSSSSSTSRRSGRIAGPTTGCWPSSTGISQAGATLIAATHDPSVRRRTSRSAW